MTHKLVGRRVYWKVLYRAKNGTWAFRARFDLGVEAIKLAVTIMRNPKYWPGMDEVVVVRVVEIRTLVKRFTRPITTQA